MKFMTRKEPFDRLVERSGLRCIEEPDRVLAARVLDWAGLYIHPDSGNNIFREDRELTEIEKTLRGDAELDEKVGEKIALSLVRYLHSEILRGFRPLVLECFDANYFAGVFDRRLSEKFHRIYSPSFRDKSVKHFQEAADIWETDVEENHGHILYRVGRAADTYSNLFNLTREHGYANKAGAYIHDLERAFNRGRISQRDRKFIEKVLERIHTYR